MRRILVTGGFGYVGGRVAKYLSTLPGTQVILGTRNHVEAPAWLPQAAIAVTRWNDLSTLRDICEGVDVVLHLSAMNEIDCAKDPVGALETNGVATVRLVEAAKTMKVKKFIYMSTAHVYGAPLIGRIDESLCPRPIHPYATSHRAAEDVVLAANNRDFNTLVLRLSNSFGAPAHPDVNRWTLLVNDLCRQAAETKKLILRSAGLQRRDFVTLTDVERAIAHILEIPRSEFGDGIINVGGGWAPTIFEMTEFVAKRCNDVLGFYPEIVRPSSTQGEISEPLDYRVDKLLSTGFRFENNYTLEIDATLNICMQAFADK
jgi:UDP-glucose 4-epimerase